MKKNKIGKVYPRQTLFLRNHIGSAEGKDKLEYDMATLIGGTPIIQSKQTGKWFTLSWGEIINMAVEAGIDIHESKKVKNK